MDHLEERLVTKSNALVRSKFQLTLVEMRLLLCVIAQLNSKERLDSTKRYYLHAQTYAEMFGIQQDGDYQLLKEAIDTLYNRTIKIKRDGSQEDAEFRWIQSKSYIDKKGMVSIMIGHDVIPYLSELQNQFTQYFLNEIKQLDTIYSVRLYELAKSYLSLKYWIVELDTFRQIFDISPDYRQDNIQARIIKPSIELINKHTSLKINFEPYKVGRSIAGYRFNIGEKRKSVEPSESKKVEKKPLFGNSFSWSMSENTMFKKLQAFDSELTKEDIEIQAISNNCDLSLILHSLIMEISKQKLSSQP